MTAIENVLVGQHHHLTSTLDRARSLRTRAPAQRGGAWPHDEARRLLHFVGLQGTGDILASKLPYGDQRRLEVARALANKPRLLLLDEPTAGMNPAETAQMTDFIRRLRDDLGITILLIEHEMRVVMGISERITVLDYGEQDRRGRRRARSSSDPRVIEAYLGRGAAAEITGVAAERRAERGRRRSRERTPDGRAELTDGPARVDDLHTYYGNIHALRGHLARRSSEGEIVTLIGANGAGKTTTLNTISGLVRAAQRPGPAATARTCARYPPHEIVTTRRRPGARGPADLRPADGRGEPADGRASSSRTRPSSRDGIERAFDAVPAAASERAAPGRRHA